MTRLFSLARPGALAAAALLALLGAAPTPAAAQRDDAQWLEQCRDGHSRRGAGYVRHCEVRTERMAAGRRLEVDGGKNGGVSVRAWDGNEVRVSARVVAHARTAEEAREVARLIRVHASDGRVRAEGPAQERESGWAVGYEILVPRRYDLQVETHNGPVRVVGVHGRMALRAHNGPLALQGVGGDVNARVQNGPVSVELEGARWNGEGLDVETVNGPVRLELPRGYSAELEVGTARGPVTMDVPMPEGYRSGRRVRTTLGSGGPPVRVVTTNGPVVVRRAES